MGSDPTEQIEGLAKKLELGETPIFILHCLKYFVLTLTIVSFVSCSHNIFLSNRMQSYIHGARARGACKEARSDVNVTSMYSELIKYYIDVWLLDLICGLFI